MADVSKLPKWAQRRIENLERAVGDLKARLTTGPANSDTYVRDYIHGDTPLGEATVIRFEPAGRESRLYFEVVLERGALSVRGSEAIRVCPHASNVIRVELEQR